MFQAIKDERFQLQIPSTGNRRKRPYLRSSVEMKQPYAVARLKKAPNHKGSGFAFC